MHHIWQWPPRIWKVVAASEKLYNVPGSNISNNIRLFALLIEKDGGIGPFEVLATLVKLGANSHPRKGAR